MLYEKRPETGRFWRPVYDSKSGKYKISYADIVCLTEGLQRTEIGKLARARKYARSSEQRSLLNNRKGVNRTEEEADSAGRLRPSGRG